LTIVAVVRGWAVLLPYPARRALPVGGDLRGPRRLERRRGGLAGLCGVPPWAIWWRPTIGSVRRIRLQKAGCPRLNLWQSTPRASRDFWWSDPIPDRRGRGGRGRFGHLRGQPGSSLLRRRLGRLRHCRGRAHLRGHLPLRRLGIQPSRPALPAPGLAGVLLLAQLPPPAHGGPPFGPGLSRLPDLPAGSGPGSLAGPPAGVLGGGAGHSDHLPVDLWLAGVPVRQRHRAGLHDLRARVPDHHLRRPVAAGLGGVPRPGHRRGDGAGRLRLVPVAPLPPPGGDHRPALRLRLLPAGRLGGDLGDLGCC